MKAKELKQLSEEELKGKLIELKKEFMKSNIRAVGNKNPSKIKVLRRTIARINQKLKLE